jgi:magnesium chelatase family protein
VSGPLLDRIDLIVPVNKIKTDELIHKRSSEKTKDVHNRILKAREIQKNRFKDCIVSTNNEMSNKNIREFCKLDQELEQLAKSAINNINLSARSYMRVLKVSRTIADLEDSKDIKKHHFTEALQYRVAKTTV